MSEMVPVHFDISRLKPIISEMSFNLHYNSIYSEHLNAFDNQSGDIAFNKAGAYLHGLFFENIREARKDNKPTGKIAQIIEMRYGNFENFVLTLKDQAKRIQGNGWLFMNNAGYINIIPNNRIVDNIAMIIDVWEHAYILDYGNRKEDYVQDSIFLIDWEVVNKRIDEINKKKEQKHKGQ